ncbi:hypothetical protein EK904_010040 [Melospiza melodia maxima]|nr:hypothetical protein EK904_010040 [Melospiza melodia maxima]
MQTEQSPDKDYRPLTNNKEQASNSSHKVEAEDLDRERDDCKGETDDQDHKANEMDIFISRARFLLPAVRLEVIARLRNKATSLTAYSGFILRMSAAMKSFWK